MAGVHGHLNLGSHRRRLALSLALAVTLAVIPLQRLAAAAHDPVSAGAGMGSRAPVMLEAGARMAAPGTATGLPGMDQVPLRGSRAAPAGPAAIGQARRGPAPAVRRTYLAAYGRLQLEGG